MEKNNKQASKEWLVALHHSLNLFGIIFLIEIFVMNAANSNFWRSFYFIVVFVYGFFSGLTWAGNSKYVLFRKSFWIILLTTFWIIIINGPLLLEEEIADRLGYWHGFIRGIHLFASDVIVYFLGVFLIGYMIAILIKVLKRSILNVFYYSKKHIFNIGDKLAIFYWSLASTAFFVFLSIFPGDSLFFIFVFFSAGSSLYGILSGLFRKKEMKSILINKAPTVFFLTLIMLLLVLPLIMAIKEKEYPGSLMEETIMNLSIIAMAELIFAVIPFVFGLLLGNIVGLVFFIYDKFIDFFNKNVIYNAIYKIFIKFVIASVSLVYIGIIWLWFSILSFDGFYSPMYVFDLYNQDRYYQNHIGKKLVKYGQEYKIDKVHASYWKNYKDKENKFQFEYPANLELEIKNIELPYKYQLNFVDNNYICAMEVIERERGVGREWLPKTRNRFDYDIKNNNKSKLWYFYAKNGKVFNIYSTNFEKGISSQNDKYKFTYIDFISDNKIDKVIKISDSGNTCPEYLIKGILGTFEFVE